MRYFMTLSPGPWETAWNLISWTNCTVNEWNICYSVIWWVYGRKIIGGASALSVSFLFFQPPLFTQLSWWRDGILENLRTYNYLNNFILLPDSLTQLDILTSNHRESGYLYDLTWSAEVMLLILWNCSIVYNVTTMNPHNEMKNNLRDSTPG